MKPGLSDPNNHVPGISPDDGWDDADEIVPLPPSIQTAIPARRMAADGPLAATDGERTGLRIGSNVVRSDSPRRLEVQEIKSSVIRLDQTAPAPPKVERHVTFHKRPVREKPCESTRGEGREWGLGRLSPTRWLFVSGVAVAVVVIGSMALLPIIDAPNDGRPGASAAVLTAETEEKVEGVDALNDLLTKQDEAMRMFRAYVQAAHLDEVVPLIRGGEEMREMLRARWRPAGITKDWAPAAESGWAATERIGQHSAVLTGFLPGHSAFSAYFVLQGNRLLLDWKATTAFGTAKFSALDKGSGDGSEIRGELSVAEFYNTAFPEADYQAFRLVSPSGETVIWCYARRGGAAEGEIGPLFRRGEIVQEPLASRKATLRLERGPEGSQPNQWQIAAMLHIGWVTP